jgi:RNA polymerase sigma-70 factor (ECF subfamily)
MSALRQLPTDDRVLLGLRFGADLAVADVAAALDIPLGTAKSRLHRALGRLAAAMGDEDDQ